MPNGHSNQNEKESKILFIKDLNSSCFKCTFDYDYREAFSFYNIPNCNRNHNKFEKEI